MNYTERVRVEEDDDQKPEENGEINQTSKNSSSAEETNTAEGEENGKAKPDKGEEIDE